MTNADIASKLRKIADNIENEGDFEEVTLGLAGCYREMGYNYLDTDKLEIVLDAWEGTEPSGNFSDLVAMNIREIAREIQ